MKLLLLRFTKLLCILSLPFITGFAQTDSVKWALTADSDAIAFGNISGKTEMLSNLVVRSYNGGVCQKTAPNSTGAWSLEAGQNNTRYLQFAASPSSGYSLTVTAISFTIGWAGTTNNIFAHVYYSTDSTFSSKTQLGSTITLANSGGTAIGFTSLNITVGGDSSLYLRFYPWAGAALTSGKNLGLANVLIAGTAAPSGLPSLTMNVSSLFFANTKINAIRDLQFTISGSNLTPANDSIHVTAPAGFGVSTISGSGYASSTALPYSGSTLNVDTVYVRFMPSLVQPYNGNLSVSGGGIIPQTIGVSGNSVSSSTIFGIFVSPAGNDADSGTYGHPFLTLQKALSVVQPGGDTVFVRAGTYPNNATINLSASGTADKMICVYAYPPDNAHAFFDFSSMTYGSSHRGIQLTGNYWHLKGLEVYKAGDNGINISGSYNIVENCSFHDNRDGGCQLGGTASFNRIINCDSYYNYDDSTMSSGVPDPGSNADGFSPKQLTGTNNSFYGCRAWLNSDDGWDCYEAIATVTIENCWTWSNGYLRDGVTYYSGMNGNGFKMGGNYTENDATLKNCLAFKNRSKGFDQNNNRGSMTLYNCTGYNNVGNNYSISGALNTGKTLTITNCIELGNKRSIGSFAIQATNSWLSPFTGASAADFSSLDTIGVSGPRKADGSLPDIAYMHLASGSQFVNKGTNVGLPYIGTAPDLGCFESSVLTGVTEQSASSIPHGFLLNQNYPNPFNPETKIIYEIRDWGLVRLAIYDLLGREAAVLVDETKPAGNYQVVWDGEAFPSGVYFTILESGGERIMRKMLLVK